MIEFDGVHTTYWDRGYACERTHCMLKFNQFITNFTHYSNVINPLIYIEKNIEEFHSINRINLENLINVDFNKIRKLLPKVETLQIRNYFIDGHIFENVPKLKWLYIRYSVFTSDLWMSKTLPGLESFEYTSNFSEKKDVIEFLERNPDLKIFSTSWTFIENNKKIFSKSTAKIDMFEVMIHKYYFGPFPYEKLCTFLNLLYNRGFYKRVQLHLNWCDSNANFEPLKSLKGLEGFGINAGTQFICPTLEFCTGLKEIIFGDEPGDAQMNVLAESLTNLEMLYIIDVTSVDVIMPFVRKSIKLSKVKIIPKDGINFNLNLEMLNNQRTKLSGARKIIIYTRDDVFLDTKFSTRNGETNLSLIEMKRADSFEWEPRFITLNGSEIDLFKV